MRSRSWSFNASASSIARFNGAFWTPLGEGVGGYDPRVRALTAFDDGRGKSPSLVVGGEFTTAGGIPAHRIARWVGCVADEPAPFTPCRYEVEPF